MPRYYFLWLHLQWVYTCLHFRAVQLVEDALEVQVPRAVTWAGSGGIHGRLHGRLELRALAAHHISRPVLGHLVRAEVDHDIRRPHGYELGRNHVLH